MHVGPSSSQGAPEALGREETPSTCIVPQARRSDTQVQTPAEFQMAQAHMEAGEPQPRRSSASVDSEAPVQAQRPEPEFSQGVMEEMYRSEAKSRAAQFPTIITPANPSAHAPVHRIIRLRHVQQVLTDMLSNDAARFIPEDISGPARYEESAADGITLTEHGCKLLADYYSRTYGANIRFHAGSAQIEVDLVRDLLALERQVPGEHARAAHYFGTQRAGHGAVLIYIREAGKEALLWFDSTQDEGLRFGMELAKDCANLAEKGKSIPVYQHVWSLQKAAMGCTVFAMKAAATLTSRSRIQSGDENVEFGSFTRPELLKALNDRRLKAPAPEGVVPVWALPELARMGQSPKMLSAHAGPDLDETLPGSKGETLRTLLQRHTYESTPFQPPSYARDKGEQFAEIVDIEQASLSIGKHVGAESWSRQRQDDFARKMREVMSLPPTIDHAIEDLELRLRKHQFAQAAGFVFRLIEAEQTGMPEVESVASLIKQLSDDGLEIFARDLDANIASWAKLSSRIQPIQNSSAVEDMVQLRKNVESNLSPLRETKRQVRNELNSRKPGTSLTDVMEIVPDTSIKTVQEDVDDAARKLETIERVKFSFGDPEQSAKALKAMTDDELKVYTDDLNSHRDRLDTLGEQFARIADALELDPRSHVESAAQFLLLTNSMYAALNMVEAELGLLQEVLNARS